MFINQSNKFLLIEVQILEAMKYFSTYNTRTEREVLGDSALLCSFLKVGLHSRGRICPSHKELCKKRPSSGIAEIEKRHERLYREECCSVAKSFPALQPPGLWPVRLLWPWRFPGLSTGAGCPFFPQMTFLTQGSNLSLGALPLHPRGSPAGRNTSFGCDSNFADLK